MQGGHKGSVLLCPEKAKRYYEFVHSTFALKTLYILTQEEKNIKLIVIIHGMRDESRNLSP